MNEDVIETSKKGDTSTARCGNEMPSTIDTGGVT